MTNSVKSTTAFIIISIVSFDFWVGETQNYVTNIISGIVNVDPVLHE